MSDTKKDFREMARHMNLISRILGDALADFAKAIRLSARSAQEMSEAIDMLEIIDEEDETRSEGS